MDDKAIIDAAFVHWGTVLLQLLLATVCGGLIGYQRERAERPAGFRTHVLVCVGSTVYMLVSYAVAGNQYDPGRIAAQVASGIGFLGAGTIIKQGSVVRGLTTAASLWAAAGIGLAVGVGGQAVGIALLATGVVLLALGGLSLLEARMVRRQHFGIFLQLHNPRPTLDAIQQLLRLAGIEVTGVTITREHDDTADITLDCRALTRDDIARAMGKVSAIPQVNSVHWEYR